MSEAVLLHSTAAVHVDLLDRSPQISAALSLVHFATRKSEQKTHHRVRNDCQHHLQSTLQLGQLHDNL